MHPSNVAFSNLVVRVVWHRVICWNQTLSKKRTTPYVQSLQMLSAFCLHKQLLVINRGSVVTGLATTFSNHVRPSPFACRFHIWHPIICPLNTSLFLLFHDSSTVLMRCAFTAQWFSFASKFSHVGLSIHQTIFIFRFDISGFGCTTEPGMVVLQTTWHQHPQHYRFRANTPP